MILESAFWLFVYCFVFFGSISFSYLLMRTLKPEFRELSFSGKLRYSFFISIVSFAFAVISSSFFGREFLFAAFPVIVFSVYIFDEIIRLPHKKVIKKVAIPVRRRK